MKKINRRTFLGNGAAAAAMVTVGKPFAPEGNDKLIPSEEKQ